MTTVRTENEIAQELIVALRDQGTKSVALTIAYEAQRAATDATARCETEYANARKNVRVLEDELVALVTAS